MTPIGMIAGRPAGMQIIGRRYLEDMVLDAMEVIESRVGVLTQALWEKEV